MLTAPKKRKRRKAKDKTCFAYRESGSCEYGENCKFLHVLSINSENDTPGNEMLKTNTSFFPLDSLSFTDSQVNLYKQACEILKARNISNHIFYLTRSYRPVPYIKRQFVQFFTKQHLIISLHSNGICVLSLSPLHPIFALQNSIKSF